MIYGDIAKSNVIFLCWWKIVRHICVGLSHELLSEWNISVIAPFSISFIYLFIHVFIYLLFIHLFYYLFIYSFTYILIGDVNIDES